MNWAHSAVVARPLCMRKAPGSIPGVSILALVFHLLIRSQTQYNIMLFTGRLKNGYITCEVALIATLHSLTFSPHIFSFLQGY